MGTHILVPKEGVAVHINAFNFPVWGMLEKIAVNLLAGMPCIVKPATVTSYLTEAVVKEIIDLNHWSTDKAIINNKKFLSLSDNNKQMETIWVSFKR